MCGAGPLRLTIVLSVVRDQKTLSHSHKTTNVLIFHGDLCLTLERDNYNSDVLIQRMFNYYSAGIDLTSTVDPRTVRVIIFIIGKS